MQSLGYYSRIQGFRINKEITARELRVLDEQGGNLGVMSLENALAEAATKGLDLILITQNVNPPIAKITSFDKFRYEKEKEFKKQRLAQKTLGMKQVQISLKEAKNDLMTKVRRLEGFLEDGHNVEIVMTLFGREKGMKDYARVRLQEFLGMITIPYTLNQGIKDAGRGLNAQVAKK
ncbi:MAG: translation initiation factor IF-3 [Candidatus Colwellbacteria bacterium RIFCSPHIGHO2_02_FULL_43_15]|uniref:Translation initiation factor IF-3 n=1 Tax=Candidatus Colwellbacteria bacterium RIFCSPHIGHO2_02_FULL_43_15 TaxID=1797686 RepID=A0A1G1Z3A5_9BACT|nr:MAG: translation initiation factor IF-3 [Candidatus Colwellbacteria bacterium RIFCSPHIGHO2_02_FULL_43_15]